MHVNRFVDALVLLWNKFPALKVAVPTLLSSYHLHNNSLQYVLLALYRPRTGRASFDNKKTETSRVWTRAQCASSSTR
jgi:hypothetical protein